MTCHVSSQPFDLTLLLRGGCILKNNRKSCKPSGHRCERTNALTRALSRKGKRTLECKVSQEEAFDDLLPC